MSLKRIVLGCSCDTEVCSHLYEQISDMLQEGYDEGYDEGWTDAWEAIREGLAEMGYKSAKDIRIPEPPPRPSTKKKTRSPGKKERDFIN
jgi:hypothetical protein